eukprot:gene21092-1167_t
MQAKEDLRGRRPSDPDSTRWGSRAGYHDNLAIAGGTAPEAPKRTQEASKENGRRPSDPNTETSNFTVEKEETMQHNRAKLAKAKLVKKSLDTLQKDVDGIEEPYEAEGAQKRKVDRWGDGGLSS